MDFPWTTLTKKIRENPPRPFPVTFLPLTIGASLNRQRLQSSGFTTQEPRGNFLEILKSIKGPPAKFSLPSLPSIHWPGNHLPLSQVLPPVIDGGLFMERSKKFSFKMRPSEKKIQQQYNQFI